MIRTFPLPLCFAWVSCEAHPLRSEDGEHLGHVGALTDITDRKRAEEALRDSEETYRLTLGNISDAVFITNDAGDLTFVCPNANVIFGYSQEEVEKLGHISRLLGHDIYDPEELASRSEIPNIERRAADKNGREHHLLVTVKRIEVKDGTVLFTCRDVTHRQKAELKFRGLLESAPDAMVIVDRRGRIVLVNTQTESLFGYKREEVLAQPIEILVPDRLKDRHAEHRKNYFSEPKVRRMGAGLELFGRRKDGSEFPVEISLSPLETEEGILVSSSIRDISDRKRVEEANRNLAHVQRLAVMGELTAMIAHEVNQPLGAILSNAEAAEMLLESPNPPLDNVREILADIRSNDLRADQSIRRIRSLLRNREMQMEHLDLNEAISEVLRLAAGDAVKRHVRIRTDLADELPPVAADRVHLQQVLLNLIFNAMEAMRDTPESDRDLTARTTRRGSDTVEVAVADRGCGIEPDRLARLFDSFFTSKQDGMGLGLSIARSIIEAHRGRIWAENNEDGGATFRFTLPASGRSAAGTL